MADPTDEELDALAGGGGAAPSGGGMDDDLLGSMPAVGYGDEDDGPQVLGGFARRQLVRVPRERIREEVIQGRRRNPMLRGTSKRWAAKTGVVYVEGDEYLPGLLTTEEVASLQDRMVRAGLLDDGEFVPGVWGTASAEAYALVLTEANATGQAPIRVLADLRQLTAESRKKELAERKRQARAEIEAQRALDPDTVTSKVVADIESVIGRKPTEDELAKFAARFSALSGAATAADVAAAEAQIDAEGTGAAPVLPAEVDVAASFEQELETAFAPTVRANEAMEEMNVAQHNLLGMADRIAGLIGRG